MAMHWLTMMEMARGLESREFSATELVEHLLSRVAFVDGSLNSFITMDRERALIDAAHWDEARSRNQHPSPLAGVPMAHKDIFCTKNQRTTCASRMLEDFVPPYNATVVERLAEAGMVCLGKTNMDEFAMGSSNETSYFGPVRNPWDITRVPGGSSGGSAAAVAAGLVPLATGTDTGGSIRQPAALCGISGLKPTYGRVSRWGMVAYASSLDQAGLMARSVEDIACALSYIAGFDDFDSTSADEAVGDYIRMLDAPGKMKAGLPKQFFSDGIDAGVAAVMGKAVDALRALGIETVELDIPELRYAIPAYYVIAPAEASSNLARYDGVRFGHRCDTPADLEDLYKRSRGEGFGVEVQRRILVGTYVLSHGYYDAYYLTAQKVRHSIRRALKQALAQVDFLVAPTAPEVAFPLGSKNLDPVAMYMSDICTIAVNLAGLPALSLPVGFSSGLPVGMQLIGDDFDEARLLQAGHLYQKNTAWHRHHPDVATYSGVE